MRRILLATAALISLVGPRNAWTATVTGSMAVSATVTTACSFSTSSLAFGEVSSSATSSTATITVTCTSGGAYTVGLGNGLHAVGALRNLQSGGNVLSYGLFQDSAHGTVWTDVGAGLVSGTGNAAAQALTVYGAIPAGQALLSGNGTPYTDTVVVTLTY